MAAPVAVQMPVRAAAKVLGVSVQRVYQLVESGKLSARKVDSTWLVDGRSVADRYREKGGVGDGRRSGRRRV
jgi:excisionase family DNA binding protein